MTGDFDKRRRLAILGATGSVGRNTLDVVRRHADRLEIVALAAGHDSQALEELAREHGVTRLALADPRAAERAGIPGGPGAVEELAALPEVDCVVNAVVGAGGLRPSLRAVETGKLLALANKESLVVGGQLLTALARQTGAIIIPIDSEHNAALQLMTAVERREVAQLVLTASGGPFRATPEHELRNVTPAQVLNHPTWSMGPRITVDSATLLNKGFEVIEARWLFDVPLCNIDVVVHPQSVIHALVHLVDGSVLANMSRPDMRIPIQLALSWPRRWPSEWPRIDLKSLEDLSFEPPDLKRFPCLALAMEAAEAGGTAPAVLNAADEELVRALLDGRLAFIELPEVLGEVLRSHAPAPAATLEAIHAADAWAREHVRTLLGHRRERADRTTNRR